jgi:hypothetical protein
VPQDSIASRSRRRFVAAGTTVLAASLVAGRNSAAPIVNAPALLENPEGGYRVLPAGTVFCGGVTPLQGHEIVHVLLQRWIPLQEAWPFMQNYLRDAGLSVQALCGLEVRIPQQLTFEGFRAFNIPYAEQLLKWNLMLGRYSAVCRTAVVPANDPPSEPAVHAFSYCAPSGDGGKTFCLSGAADIDPRGQIVAAGDASPQAMKQKLQQCVDTLTERLAMLEFTWSAATHIDLCVAQDMPGLMATVLSLALQGAASRGVRVHFARPAFVGAEVELECRASRRELVMSA